MIHCAVRWKMVSERDLIGDGRRDLEPAGAGADQGEALCR